jgi:dihydropteroate synthase
MGILNVTPDSFSDGGLYIDTEKAVAHGLAMARDGAAIIDVGGESTRPFSTSVSSAEEMERVIPVIDILSKKLDIPVSIDTRKSAVAREALRAGASIINDISALSFDSDMATVAAETEAPVILMHMKGTPENMQEAPRYDDLFGEISTFFEKAISRAVSAGIREEMIILDPGIGFGKSFNDNLMLIRDLANFSDLGKPLMLGTSNKAFIGHILDKEAAERDAGTMATLACGVMAGAHIVRVHNVMMAYETIKMVESIKRGAVRRAGFNSVSPETDFGLVSE